MTESYNKWKKSGFEILAVPCNQFNNQEPGTAADINNFVKNKFESEFPLLEKIEMTILGFSQNG